MFLVSQTQAVYARRHVLWTLVKRDLRVRYARSWLGYLWTVIDPLAMAGIYFVVFVLIFDRGDVGYQPYFLFLLVGLLAWQWFSSAVTDTSRALLAEARLVRSTNLPRELWVVRVVIAKGIEFALSLPVLLAFAIVYVVRGEASVGWQVVLFPVGMLMQFVLQLGIGLILAPITVLVTDMQRVVRIALRMGFYASPIIYSLDQLGSYADWMSLNPLTGIVELYRAGFFPQEVSARPIIISSIVILAILAVGVATFTRYERAVLKEI